MLPIDNRPKIADIVAAQKIIADISSGVYRSPAAALKELVSNSYDADATSVTITTDAPDFRTLTIKDDGNGMSIEKFIDVLNHIGGSRKRLDGDQSPFFKRKLIGRIGIGMLAVAQLGNRFYVSSSENGSPTRFIAEVNLDPFHRDDTALQSMGKLKSDGQVQIGAIRYVDDVPELLDAHYTVITIPDAKKGLISEMTSAIRKAVGAKERLSIYEKKITSFDELINVVRSSKRADLSLDGYYYMLWELALLCPINYSDNGLFDNSMETTQIENVRSIELPVVNKFKVTVDEIEIRRPQRFPNNAAFDYPSPNPVVYPLSFDNEVAGRRLKLTGYIYSQQPRIDPEELKGLHIRIKNVGIGKYDKSWLGYPFDEGIKFGQVTGEVFVDDGLEPALNIDRDSFRETDVHYQAMRAYIWSVLREKVFPDFKSRGNEYRIHKKKAIRSSYLEKFSEKILQLPAPIIIEPKISHSVVPSITSWIEVTDSNLIIAKKYWDNFIEENNLTADARERFLRVLTVLASSELLVDLKEDEINGLLEALAVAVI